MSVTKSLHNAKDITKKFFDLIESYSQNGVKGNCKLLVQQKNEFITESDTVELSFYFFEKSFVNRLTNCSKFDGGIFATSFERETSCLMN